MNGDMGDRSEQAIHHGPMQEFSYYSQMHNNPETGEHHGPMASEDMGQFPGVPDVSADSTALVEKLMSDIRRVSTGGASFMRE